MNIIRHNPFRVLGLLSNASERELQKQIGIIKRYAEVGKVKSFDYDFDIIGALHRTQDEIQQASNKIEQPQKKLLYSLFWFINNNQLDEIAHNNLRDKNIDKAIEIWDKTLKDNVTSKNFSAYLNLSTLYIAMSTTSERIILDKLKIGILLKGKLIHSENFRDLSNLVTRSEIIFDSNEISEKFVDEIVELLKKYLNRMHGVSTHGLISLFSSFPKNIQKYASNKFTEIPFSDIETKIEKTIRKRKNKPGDAEKYGEELYQSTKSDILLLKQLIGENNVQFQLITNKLANELLECSIVFFNEYRDDEDFDPGDDAVKIVKYAKSIALNGQVKDRIIENLSIIQEWVDEKPERERGKIISGDVDFLVNKLKDFQLKDDSIHNSQQLLVSCEDKLNKLKNNLGSSDDLYLKLSNSVVSNALGMIIDVVNREQDQIQYDKTKLETLPSTFSSAVAVLNKMKYFDMNSETRNRLNTNTKVISDINSQLISLKNQSSSSSSSYNSSSSSGGCYIATMAYGNYNHPQVLILRSFRDEKLSKHMLGRGFIRMYYAISPHLVRILKDSHNINRIIRNILDELVKKVK